MLTRRVTRRRWGSAIVLGVHDDTQVALRRHGGGRYHYFFESYWLWKWKLIRKGGLPKRKESEDGKLIQDG